MEQTYYISPIPIIAPPWRAEGTILLLNHRRVCSVFISLIQLLFNSSDARNGGGKAEKS